MGVTEAQRGKYRIGITNAQKKLHEADGEVHFDRAYQKLRHIKELKTEKRALGKL
jgi:hypothetical protein